MDTDRQKEKTVVITQSNYIPWKGYFDQLNAADHFVVYDDMQYTRRDWRNRNKIKTAQGLLWLSIPVEVKGKFTQKIRETRVAEKDWALKHWRTIEQNYAKAKYFDLFHSEVKSLYEEAGELSCLSEINVLFIKFVFKILGIQTRISWSHEYELDPDRTLRLARICEQLGATRYISGPAAKAYMDETLFRDRGVSVEYFDYSGYLQYPQLFGEFEHAVTVLDLLFNVGMEAPKYLKTFSAQR